MKRRALIAASLALATGARAAVTRRAVHGAPVSLDIDGEPTPAFTALAWRWIEKCAGAVALYYGKFPVPELYIHLVPEGGPGVRGGQTFPGEMPMIRIRLGEGSTERQLLGDDWVMVHEMVHLAFPWMNMKHNWMAEGLAVYVESIARVQAGHIPPRQVWADFMKMMPRGLPQDGDGGFEVTVNWGRTYWGGAMFCLMADIEIRRQTGNNLGLQHALRAINAARDFRQEWDFRETLAIGDKATGTTVLVSQFDTMKEEPVKPDLAGLWKDLGLAVSNGVLEFDAGAPLAGVRAAIETPV